MGQGIQEGEHCVGEGLEQNGGVCCVLGTDGVPQLEQGERSDKQVSESLGNINNES